MKKALVCTIAAIAWFLAMSGWTTAEEPVQIQKSLGGLEGSVEVVIDTYGVPHIYAENEADAMFALGYLHARDRLWQMDFNRRAAQGKLSEIMGPKTLQHDTFVRTIGLNRLARQAVERAKERSDLYPALTAYSWGINSYMAECIPDGLPPEFQQIDYVPDPWAPTDSLAIGKAMAWELCGSMDDLYLGELVEKLGAETVNELFPIDRYNEIPIIPPKQAKAKAGTAIGAKPSAGKGTFSSASQDRPGVESYLAATEVASYQYRILGSNQMVGSNNWVVSGKKSVTGKPLLASDPHLGFTLPSVWYVAHVKAGDLDVIGVTLPGLPLVTIGHNRHIAWGVTNTQADVTDFFIETVNVEQKTYLHRGEWKPLARIPETIKVRGQEPQELEILQTVHGPIVPTPGAHVSAQWAGAAVEDNSDTFYLLNRAIDYDDFAAAMQMMGTPAQNFAYADTNGMIAMWVAGLFPIRKAGQGRVPSDGASGDFDWEGFIPGKETPHSADPAQQYLASANQRPAPEGYKYYLGYEWDPGYRARRINHLLSSNETVTAQQMKEFQADAYDMLAASMLPHLTAACANAFEDGKHYARALEVLSSWDYVTALDSAAPTIWWQWLERLREAVWEDDWRAAGIELRNEAWGHAGINRWMPPLEVLEKMVVEDHDSKWFDNVETENRESLAEVASTSLRTAVDELCERLGDDISKWRWEAVNKLRIEHLSGDPKLARGGQPLAGSSLTLTSKGKGGDVTGGPSWRMVVDLSDLDTLSGVYPGGQSGDPENPHYDDLIDIWARDGYIRLPFHASPEQFSPEQVEMRMTLLAPLPHVESSLP